MPQFKMYVKEPALSTKKLFVGEQIADSKTEALTKFKIRMYGSIRPGVKLIAIREKDRKARKIHRTFSNPKQKKPPLNKWISANKVKITRSGVQILR